MRQFVLDVIFEMGILLRSGSGIYFTGDYEDDRLSASILTATAFRSWRPGRVGVELSAALLAMPFGLPTKESYSSCDSRSAKLWALSYSRCLSALKLGTETYRPWKPCRRYNYESAETSLEEFPFWSAVLASISYWNYWLGCSLIAKGLLPLPSI